MPTTDELLDLVMDLSSRCHGNGCATIRRNNVTNEWIAETTILKQDLTCAGKTPYDAVVDLVKNVQSILKDFIRTFAVHREYINKTLKISDHENPYRESFRTDQTKDAARFAFKVAKEGSCEYKNRVLTVRNNHDVAEKILDDLTLMLGAWESEKLTTKSRVIIDNLKKNVDLFRGYRPSHIHQVFLFIIDDEESSDRPLYEAASDVLVELTDDHIVVRNLRAERLSARAV